MAQKPSKTKYPSGLIWLPGVLVQRLSLFWCNLQFFAVKILLFPDFPTGNAGSCSILAHLEIPDNFPGKIPGSSSWISRIIAGKTRDFDTISGNQCTGKHPGMLIEFIPKTWHVNKLSKIFEKKIIAIWESPCKSNLSLGQYFPELYEL